MAHCALVRLLWLNVFGCLFGVAAAHAQTTPPAATPPRPDDVQNSPLGGVQQLQLASRFRFIESGDGEITASGVQWQPSLRARLLLDADARHTVAFAT